MKKVFLKIDDIDQHGIGCPCGECNANGKSYGVGLYDVSHWTHSPLEDTPDELLDEVNHSECFDRWYGSSEQGILAQMREYIQENRWVIYE